MVVGLLDSHSNIYKICNDELFIHIKIAPCSAQNKILEFNNNLHLLKIAIKAAPENGKANNELFRFLSKEFKIPKTHLAIIKGEKNQIKILKIKSNHDSNSSSDDYFKNLLQKLMNNVGKN